MDPVMPCPDCGRWMRLPPTRATPGTRLLYRCTHCGRFWPAREHADDGATTADGTQPPLGDIRLRAAIHRVVPFWRDLPGVLVYPLRRGDGLLMLGLLWGAGFLPIVSLFVPLLLLAYGLHVMRRTARGELDTPGFPEVTDVIQGLVFPFAVLSALTAIAAAPWWLATRFELVPSDGPVGWLLLAAGAAVYPAMAMLAATGEGLLAASNPVRWLVTIRALGMDYLVLIVAVAGTAAIVVALDRIASPGKLPALAASFLQLYVLVALAHLIGRTILQTHDRIEWGV